MGVLVFEDVEVLDFAGPFEVFSAAGEPDGPPLFSPFLVASAPGPVEARGGLTVLPRHTFADCPPLDLAVVPGGFGTRRAIDDPEIVSWIRRTAERAELLLSVCTGSLLLARAGLLEGLPATTHHSAFDRLAAEAPSVRLERERRVVDNGSIVLAAGVSAGIDMAFHVLARLHGEDVADRTARYIEYDRRPPG